MTKTNVYADDSDSPAWTANSDGSWSRNVTDLTGNLAATETAADSSHTNLQLTNLHGDVIAAAVDSSAAPGITSYGEQTEFGVPRSAASAVRYGWLGAAQRSSDALGGAVLMGARLYEPATGRFLSTDAIPGGSANAYDYVDQDPINNLDLDGLFPCLKCVLGKAGHLAHSVISSVASAGHHALGWVGHHIAGAARWVWHHKGRVIELIDRVFETWSAKGLVEQLLAVGRSLGGAPGAVLIITAGVIAAAWLTAQAIQTIYDDLSGKHHHHYKKRKVVTCTRCEM